MIYWDIGTGVTKFQRTELQNILGKEGKFLICEGQKFWEKIEKYCSDIPGDMY